MRQPTRSTRVVEERRFDKTQLKHVQNKLRVHRDYLSHVLRWEFIVRELSDYPAYCAKYGWVTREVQNGFQILDVGCGQEQPLAHVLSYKLNTLPQRYVGVDLNKIQRKFGAGWAKVLDEFDFTARHQELGKFDVAACLEVIEHMGVDDGARLLDGIRECLLEGGILYLSTPVFDGRAAANHVHEYTIPELSTLVAACGFEILERRGTFASVPDIERAMKQADDVHALDVWGRLKGWFGGDVLSVFMASLYPDASRNNIWVLRKA